MSGFEAQAGIYDSVALVQAEVAARLAARIEGAPRRILEIGCGTGLLSAHLARRFPGAEMVLTDIAPAMLAQAQARLGDGAKYLVMDGQRPDPALGHFDLIASSLAFQWFDDLPGALTRLGALLAPGGVLHFATLGSKSFAEWRQAHEEMGLACGLRDYVSAEDFPWPPGLDGRIGVEMIEERHETGQAFLRGMKMLGAAQSPARHRPVGAGQFRALLGRFSGGFTARYQILFGTMRTNLSAP
jgi:malonyl-CoA O-methyltransferase